MFRLFLILAVCCVSLVRAETLWVDASDGSLKNEMPEQVAMWPDVDGHCRDSIDALYIAHSGRYQVDEFIFQENNFGEVGGVANTMDLYDAEEAAIYMHAQGVWVAPHSCSTINHMFLTKILQPLAVDHMNQQIKGVSTSTAKSPVSGVTTARMHGIVFSMKCRDPRNTNLPSDIRDEYHVCEAGEVTNIIQGRQSQIHAIRADKNRRYGSGTQV